MYTYGDIASFLEKTILHINNINNFLILFFSCFTLAAVRRWALVDSKWRAFGAPRGVGSQVRSLCASIAAHMHCRVLMDLKEIVVSSLLHT